MSLCVLFLLVLPAFYFYKRKPFLSRFLFGTIPVILLLLLRHFGSDNLFLQIKAPFFNFTLYSIYEVIIIALFGAIILYYITPLIKMKILSLILFNVSLVGTMSFCDLILKSLDFNYMEFGISYLTVAVAIFLLHIIPLFFIRAMILVPGNKQQTGILEKKYALLILGAQIIFIGILGYFNNFDNRIIHLIIMSIVMMVILFYKRRFFPRAIFIFLMAVSAYLFLSGHSMAEKKDYVENNLKNIFLNQSNYAKFIAREIVMNLSNRDLNEFFHGDASAQLQGIWRKTIASRENIASGIFVYSAKEKRVINQFAYQIPFLEVNLDPIYPFWAIEDTTAIMHGKEIPLAVAFIGINNIKEATTYESEYLGYIIVEILNSPELLLRYQDKVNIFTIDKNIEGQEFSYIKLNPDYQVVENPSNINLQDIAGLLNSNKPWVKFHYMDLTFRGYLFHHGGNAIIIFFPLNSIFKDMAETIKLFLIFSFLFLLFYFKDLKNMDWASIYYSFSIRVFVFLILISLLTAIVFSIFFINYSSRSMEQKVQRMVYENGRIAQNIAYNLIQPSDTSLKNNLFSISDILSSDVSVYGKNGLIETTNYHKIINSQVPEYLHSNIVDLLEEKNQKFVVEKSDKSFHLYFKVYDYIFMVQFSNNWERALSEERYYTDFIITLFFILIITGFSIAFFFRNKILSPIDGLRSGMAEVEKGNLVTLEHIPSELEIKNLYLVFNSMLEGIREQRRNISEISRMKTIIRLGRHVAHEVKNPLTPIKLSAEQILRVLADKNPGYEEMIKQSVNYIIDETDHLKKVSYGFLDLSKMDEINTEEFDLVPLIHDEMFNVKQLFSHIDFQVEIRGENGSTESPENIKKGVRVKLDKIKIKQLLKNIINNSIEAIGDKKGEIRLFLEKANGRIFITLEDNGIGMNEEESRRLFELDYTTKEIGSGLGLFIVKRIIELHKGHIRIQSEKNKGTTIFVDLPEKVE